MDWGINICQILSGDKKLMKNLWFGVRMVQGIYRHNPRVFKYDIIWLSFLGE